ncbi:MAG: SGNH/GDSL hydrolase family protein [Pseudolabrys sp.]
MARLKSILASLVLCLLGLCLGLALAEGLVRVFYPHARDIVISGHPFILDDELGWKLAPSKTTTHHCLYFDTGYTTNSFGFRDKPRSTAKSDDAYRILLYGDSLIFGWGLNDGERFSDLIENERAGLEIWNLGVPGWGLDQEILLNEKEGKLLHADEVIFFVGPSTLSRIHTGYLLSKYKPMFTQHQDGRLTVVPIPKGKNAVLRFLYETLSDFYLPYFLQAQIATFQETVRLREGPADGLAKDMLRMAWDTTRRRNQRMTILVANLSHSDRSDLRALCNETGIKYLEIGPEVLATATVDSDLIFGQYDNHWNAKTNKLIAAALLRQLRSCCGVELINR